MTVQFKSINERFIDYVIDKARPLGFTKRQRESAYMRTKLYRLYAYAYQKALDDLANELESHDYFSEASKARFFAKTSGWVVYPEIEKEQESA